MTIRKPSPQSPNGLMEGPMRDILESVEQVLAGGWYPARRHLLSRLAGAASPDLPVWVPEADIEETPVEIVVSFALPGVEKSDIRVEATEDSITVTGRRPEEERTPGSCRREMPRGEFLRRVRLPSEVKPQAAKASSRNGILRVSLPRSKAAFGRSVKID